jgi:hypothetical protein
MAPKGADQTHRPRALPSPIAPQVTWCTYPISPGAFGDKREFTLQPFSGVAFRAEEVTCCPLAKLLSRDANLNDVRVRDGLAGPSAG